jgi:hypothetical protein
MKTALYKTSFNKRKKEEMKHKLTITVITSGLLAFAPLSNAAVFDFQAWISTNGEQGFDNSTPFTLSDSGLMLTAKAFENPSRTDSHVYMDDSFNGIIGGMGVCTILDGDQCSPSSDDNVSIDGTDEEVLSWNFSQSITELKLDMGNSEHPDFVNSDFQYSLDTGLNWLTATTNGNGLVTLMLSGGTNQIEFRAAGNTLDDNFYIRSADATVVPVPAAIWLFGSGLLGLIGVARRKKT